MHRYIVPTATLTTMVILMLLALLLLLPDSSLADTLADNTGDPGAPTTPADGEQLDNQLYLPLVTNGSPLQEDSSTAAHEMVMAAAAGESFPALDVRMIGDTTKIGVGGVPGCSQEIHDLYFVTGPDGKKYRTWHALWHPKGVNGIPSIEQIIAGKADPACYFAHEHGDVPLAIAKPATGAPLPAFGYAALRAMGMVEDHAGYKVFTHLQGQQTGWHQPQLGWSSRETANIAPDWDIQVTVHQGTPSFKSNSNQPGATRITQRFHEITFWMQDPQGRVTNIQLVSDTGSALGSAGCFSLASFLAGGSPNRLIADGCRPGATPSTYENWRFEVEVEGAWSAAPEVDVVNPMDYVVNLSQQRFKNASEELCGIETELDGCTTKLPFGHPGTPALAFMGTQRNIHNPTWRWRNANGSEYICTDAYGQRVTQSRCNQGDATVILQRVALINAAPANSGPFDRTGTSSMFNLAFPRLTDDPNRPYDCNAGDCTWRMPQGAPLGN